MSVSEILSRLSCSNWEQRSLSSTWRLTEVAAILSACYKMEKQTNFNQKNMKLHEAREKQIDMCHGTEIAGGDTV